MSSPRFSVFFELFLQPDSLNADSLAKLNWTEIVSIGRQLSLLARLYFELNKRDLWSAVPANAQVHLQSAWIQAEKQRVSLIWEAQNLSRVLQPSCRAVILKGAAYAVKGLENSFGRFVSDIDILVAKEQLKTAEFELFVDGWLQVSHDKYDDYYYRQWMHELPPLHHNVRQTTLDLHHNILPIIARHKIDPSPILEAASVVNGVLVPCNEDLLLHCATHLFHEGDFNKIFRDLLDTKDLFMLVVQQSDSGLDKLLARSSQLGLQKEMALALFFLNKTCGLNISETAQHFIRKHLSGKAGLSLLSWCYTKVFLSSSYLDSSFAYRLAARLLFVRSHLLKMPVHILLPHLVWKMWKSVIKSRANK